MIDHNNNSIPPPHTIQWYHSLGFKTLVAVALLSSLLLAGTVAIVSQKGEELVLAESKQRIAQAGENTVNLISARLREIQALARTFATTVAQLPKTDVAFRSALPELIDFQGDLAVAGGGYWPEPFQFNKHDEKHSFFWGRDHSGQLKFFNDYNISAVGYHREEWYVPAQFTKANHCFWSRSYMDPYSFEPMTTCTIHLAEQGKFVGTVTIDVKLEGLSDLVRQLKEQSDAEVFILDRNNRFLTFPNPEIAKKIGVDDNGKRTEEFITLAELAEKVPSYAAISQSVNDVNKQIIDSHIPVENTSVAEIIEQKGRDIDKAEAHFIAATIQDPLRDTTKNKLMIKDFIFEEKLLFHKPALATIFHVPGAYWKVVMITRLDDITAVATSLTHTLFNYLALTVIIFAILAYVLLRSKVIKPLSQTTSAIAETHAHLSFSSNDRNVDPSLGRSDEIKLLSQTFSSMAEALAKAEDRTKKHARDLEDLNLHLKTEREKVMHSAKLATLGELAASTAHEINNALAIITTGTSTIQSTINSPEKFAKRLAIIDKAVTRIAKITGSIRKYARSTVSDPFDIFSLKSAIDEALIIVNPKAEKNGVTVTVECGEDLQIFGHPLEIEQVFINLLNNASDAVSNLTERWIKIEATQNSAGIIVRIVDSGNGIPPDIASKMFQPFFTTKSVGQGTGLGMSIIKTIVSKHEGDIKLIAHATHTTFELSFPLASARKHAS